MARLFFTKASTIDRRGKISGPRTLVVEDGRIGFNGEPEGPDCPRARAGDEVLDCQGLFISPGLVNLHTHSPMNIFKGIAEDATPDRWFNEEIWPYESKMEAEDVEAGAYLAIAEMLDNGVTAFADHYFSADRICKAVLETGIRADVAPTLFGSLGNMEGQIEAAARLIGDWNGKAGRLALRLGPHSPYTCSPEDLALCAAAAKDLKVGAHLHVEDGETQADENRARYGKSPLSIVADSGLMEVPLIIGHGYWIEDEERRLLGDQTWIAVCMKTYMKLGEGPGRVWQRPGELPLCIGTDGAASSNTLSPVEQARTLALVAKYMGKNAEALPLEEIWSILMRGHEALPFGTGGLEPGCPADFLVWDLRRPNTAPIYNPLASILYSSDAANVRHSIIDGRFVKKNGSLLLDVPGIVARAGVRVEGILRRGRGKTSLVF